MMEREKPSAIVIGLHKPDLEVLWWVDGYERDEKYTTLYGRMEDYLANGNTFTILEYLPNGWHGKTDEDTLGKRAVWWDKQLREQGYDIWMGDEEEDNVD